MTPVIPIPARLAVGDETYDAGLHSGLVIHVDGVKQRNVHAYDLEAGTVSRYAMDANDRLIVRDDDFVTEIVTGVVEVRHPANGDCPA